MQISHVIEPGSEEVGEGQASQLEVPELAANFPEGLQGQADRMRWVGLG